MSQVSVYRPLQRSPRSDVHHVPAPTVGPRRGEQQIVPGSAEHDWTDRRKAVPAGFLFAATLRWMATLPLESRPTAIGEAYPRIANALAALWTRPEALTSYLNELLIDKRGGRRGFPAKVSRELGALRTHYATLHRARSDI
jgi:hypothetical protein